MGKIDLANLPYIPGGMPLYWMNEETGVLIQAMRNVFFLMGEAAPREDFELVREWCEYAINAPSWMDSPRGDLVRLRESIKTVDSINALHRWLDECWHKLEIDLI
jgi:hypothetical protein